MSTADYKEIFTAISPIASHFTQLQMLQLDTYVCEACHVAHFEGDNVIGNRNGDVHFSWIVSGSNCIVQHSHCVVFGVGASTRENYEFLVRWPLGLELRCKMTRNEWIDIYHNLQQVFNYYLLPHTKGEIISELARIGCSCK